MSKLLFGNIKGPKGDKGDTGDVTPAAIAARDEAVAAADAVAAAITGQKGAANGLAELDGTARLPESQVPERLSEAQLNTTFVRGGSTGPTKQFELRDYLEPGQVMPDAGSTSASTALQAAIDAASTWIASGAGAALGVVSTVVHVPAGVYLIDTECTPHSKVGLVGDGINRTIFKLTGGASLLYSAAYSGVPEGGWTDAHFLDDLLFQDFTVDASASTSNSHKPLSLQNVRRGRFSRVDVRNSRMTAFGIDFMIDCRFDNCYALHAGARGSTATNTYGASYSGFGFGTGRFDNESALLTNCIAENCVGAGFYVEQLSTLSGATLQPKGIQIVNCRAIGNRIGLSAAGCPVTAVGSSFYNNYGLGAFIGGVSSASISGSPLGVLNACTFEKNGDGVTTGTWAGGHGIRFGEFDSGRWLITACRFLNNLGDGIQWAPLGEPLTIGNRVESCVFSGNVAGIRVNRMKDRLTGLSVSGCIFDSNTAGGMIFEDGLDVPQFTNNQFFGATQPIGISLHPVYKTVDPVIHGNVFTDQATPLANAPTGFTLATENIVRGTLETHATALAGATALFWVEGRSDNGYTTTLAASLSTQQEMTHYFVTDVAPTNTLVYVRLGTGNAMRVQADPSATSTTCTLADSVSSVSMTDYADVVGTYVICVVRQQNAAAMYIHGGATKTATPNGWPTTTTVPSVFKGTGVPLYAAFPGAHDATTRDAIMTEIAAKYIR